MQRPPNAGFTPRVHRWTLPGQVLKGVDVAGPAAPGTLDAARSGAEGCGRGGPGGSGPGAPAGAPGPGGRPAAAQVVDQRRDLRLLIELRIDITEQRVLLLQRHLVLPAQQLQCRHLATNGAIRARSASAGRSAVYCFSPRPLTGFFY